MVAFLAIPTESIFESVVSDMALPDPPEDEDKLYRIPTGGKINFSLTKIPNTIDYFHYGNDSESCDSKGIFRLTDSKLVISRNDRNSPVRPSRFSSNDFAGQTLAKFERIRLA